MIVNGVKPNELHPLSSPPLIDSMMQSILQVNREDRPTFHKLRMAFEEIKDGEKTRLYRSHIISKSKSPEQSSFIRVPTPGTSPKPMISPHKTIYTNNLAALQKLNLSTPSLRMGSSPISSSNQGQRTAIRMYGTRRAATSSKDLLDLPVEFNAHKRASDVGIQKQTPPLLSSFKSSSSNLFPHSSKSNNLLSASAQSLSNRLAKSQSDIHAEMMKDLFPNQYKK